MSGITLAQRARAITPGIKVILASGYAAAALKAENAHVDDFQLISKPYRMAEIVKKLRTAA